MYLSEKMALESMKLARYLTLSERTRTVCWDLESGCVKKNLHMILYDSKIHAADVLLILPKLHILNCGYMLYVADV